MSENKQSKLLKQTSKLLMAIVLEGVAAAVWLLLIPREAGNAVFLGYSLRRLALLMPLSLPPVVALILRSKLKQSESKLARFLSGEKKSNAAVWLVCGGALLTVMVWSVMLLMPIMLPFIRKFPDMGAYIRLLPLMFYYLLIGLEVLLIVPLVLFPQKKQPIIEKKKFPWIPFVIALGVILGCLALIEVVGWGKDPERVSIIVMGVPMLEGQIWYVIGLLVLGLTIAFSWMSIPDGSRPVFCKRKDLLIAVLIWVVAVAFWMSMPLPVNNYFAPSVRAPNYEIYPFSDAEQYDYNSLYVYYGSLEDFVISKPLYVSFLAILHAIGGLDYARIIFMQTMVVAFLPVVLFIIGRELHSRMGGIVLALLAIFREVSAIQATNMANVSNTKLLLSDMLAALLLALLALTMIRWFKCRQKQISGHEFLIGGMVGALILTRIQTLVLIPLMVLLAIVRNWRNFKSIVLSVLVIVAAVGLVITPVLLRNHSITGVYWVDNPSSSQRLYTKFMDVGDYDIEVPEAETREEVLERNISVISTAFLHGFGEIMGFTMDNFLRNEMSAMLVLPVRLGNNLEFMDYFLIQEPFWEEVYTQPNLLNVLVILFNSGMIALGFAVACKRNPWPVLAVLSLHVVYSLSSAVVRLSGWRFIQPVDWVLYMFYAYGFLEVIMWLFGRLAHWDLAGRMPWLLREIRPAPTTSFKWSTYALSGLLFIFIGGFIPMRENLLPSLVPQYSSDEVCQTIHAALLEDDDYADLSEDFMAFCQAEETQTLKGVGIYPRVFDENDGYYQRSYDPWFGEQEFVRLTFRVIGNPNEKVYIKTDEESVRFPNGTQVLVVGRQNDKFEAQFVLIEADKPELIISSDVLSGDDLLTLDGSNIE